MTLKKTGNKKKLKKTKKLHKFSWKKLLILGVIIIAGVLTYSLFRDIPNPRKLSSGEYPESSQILDRNGKLLYEIYTEKNRISIGLTEVPEILVKATLAIEDNNFYKHSGFDLKGIARGLYRTVFQKRLQGGSTLTQQLVKNALLSPERTWERKIKEAILTIATEALYTKNQILEMYFNQTPYGGTMWGVESAAKGIFDKSVKELSLAEAALIAGLPGSPTRYSPFAHPDAAKARQEMVLKRMEELKYITTDEYERAKNEKLTYNLKRNSITAPHFVFYVKEQLIEKYGIQKVTEGGLKVWTSLDTDIQNYAQDQIATEIEKLKKMKVSNGAAIVTESKTGQILAMVGSRDYFDTEIDGKYNVTTALRQPGSSIKPLNYAVGIELGKVTAASIFDDSQTCFKVENQRPYCPTNYGGAYHGIQSLRNSLGNSLNIAAVKMLSLNGLETFVASASAMGISTFKNASDYGLSLTLGGGEVYMTDMVKAFGVFSNLGIKQDLISILKVADNKGTIIDQYQYVPGERVLSAETSYIISNILSDDGARGMVFGRGSMLNIKKHPEVAVKTGTTNDLRDNWTIGYTPENVVAVWVGNNDNTRMGGLVSGTTGAAPIWNRIMTRLLENRPVKTFTKPSGVLTMNVCNFTGLLPPEGGCESHNELFKKEYVPTTRASLQNNILIDKTTNKVVKDGEDNPNAEWQSRQSVVDATGQWVCLDCPKDENNH
ncbi:MAG TPA: transglycosylase domain-containing protein [Candidatus Methanoperedens sp.]|nr:transglycosylase domain-containing protein [Candidatus Methanoperedens sp.]